MHFTIKAVEALNYQMVKSGLGIVHFISKEGGYMGKFEINELGYNFS